jgi:hypothetical protein
MDDTRSDGIECTQTPFSKAAMPGILGLIALAMIVGIVPSHPFFWALLIALIPYSLTYSPDFIVYEDGIEVHFPWKTTFNPWDAVTKVRKNPINARIYARNLTFANVIYSLGRPWIVATSPGRRNYDEAMARIQEKIGDRFHESRY